MHAQLPTLVVGKMLGPEVLGLYWMAQRWAALPIQGLTFVANRVAYPVYARLRGEPKRLAAGYERVLQAIVSLAMPASVGLALVSGPLIESLYDPRWHVAAAPLKILAFYGLFAAVASTTGEVLKGAGTPRYVAQYAVLYNVLLTGGLASLGPALGLDGIALATVLAPLGVAAVALFTVARLLALPARRLLALLVVPVPATLAMTGVVLCLAWPLDQAGAGPIVKLVVQVLAAVVAYGLTLYRTQPGWCREAGAMLGLRWNGTRKPGTAQALEET